MNYLDWNNRIASHFFNPSHSGKIVYLTVSRKLVERLGSSDRGFNDFISALKAGPSWTTGNMLICDKALRTAFRWRDRRLQYPPYIGYLSLFVLAVPETADHSSLAYHNPLRNLLGEPPQNRPYPRFDRMIELWDDLEIWSKEDQQGQLGVFNYSFAGNHIHVGIPREQYLAGTRTFPDDNTKSCPKCKLVKSIDQGFGWRKIAGKTISQSWCYDCRGGRRARIDPGSTTIDRLPARVGQKRALSLIPRIRFLPGSTVVLTLAPRRLAAMPDSISLTLENSQTFELGKIHDVWYQDIQPSHLEDILFNGCTAQANLGDATRFWQIRGQKIFLMSATSQISGFLAHRANFVIGDRYVVLCSTSVRDEVRAILKDVGASPEIMLTDSDGLPKGFVCFKDIVPTKCWENPIPEFDLLSPQRKFEVEFLGGIRIEGATWLAGYPPNIKVSGIEEVEDVQIDGNLVSVDPDGYIKAACWDAPGRHLVSYSKRYRTYEIIEPDGEWQAWECHPVTHDHLTLTICGASLWSRDSDGNLLPVSGLFHSNRFLLGAIPGQIFIASEYTYRPSVISKRPMNLPFEPVWSLPPDPIHCDKNRDRLELLNYAKPETISFEKVEASQIAWARLILDSARKGVPFTSTGDETEALWQKYKNLAKRIRRRFNERK